jgi:iron complex outermembrane receptor protein
LTQHFQFLPSIGTAEPSPNGRIPESRADGEPAFDQFERHQYAGGYLLEQQLGRGWRLRHSTRFDHVDVDYADVFGGGLDPADPAQRLLSRSTFTILGASDVITIDSQAHHALERGAIRNTLLFGAEYQHSSFDSIDGFGEASPLDVFAPSYGAPIVRPEPYADAVTRRHQTGLYVHDRVNFRGGLVAMFSGRQNVVRDDIDNRLDGTTTEEDTDKFVWQSGVAYVSRFGLVPHFSYSESFSPLSGTDVSGTRYVPETGQQYEAGLRYQAAGGRVMVSGALFDLRRQNVLTPDPQNPNNQIQTGEVRSRGLEIELETGTAHGLSLIASYTFQDVEITKSNAGNQGLRPSVIPEQMASVWAHYTVTSGGARGLGVGGGIRYQGATLDSANVFELDGFTIVDALASYTFRALRFAVNAQNLFDKEYLAGCSGGCYFGRSRSVYGSTTYAW